MTFFQPSLRVELSPDLKTFNLEATVLVPDGCYIANGTQDGWPSGSAGIPETLPLQLLLVRRKGICTEALQTLKFARSRIPLAAGKTSVTAFVVLDDQTDQDPTPVVVGAGSIAVPQPSDMAEHASRLKASSDKSGAWIANGEVSGWIDRMPPGTPTIHIRVGVWAPTSGYKYNLRSLGGFGITGLTLLCELKATKPTGIALDVRRHTVVSLDGPLGPKNFTSVAIQFEDTLTLGPVRTVS